MEAWSTDLDYEVPICTMCWTKNKQFWHAQSCEIKMYLLIYFLHLFFGTPMHASLEWEIE